MGEDADDVRVISLLCEGRGVAMLSCPPRPLLLRGNSWTDLGPSWACAESAGAFSQMAWALVPATAHPRGHGSALWTWLLPFVLVGMHLIPHGLTQGPCGRDFLLLWVWLQVLVGVATGCGRGKGLMGVAPFFL